MKPLFFLFFFLVSNLLAVNLVVAKEFFYTATKKNKSGEQPKLPIVSLKRTNFDSAAKTAVIESWHRDLSGKKVHTVAKFTHKERDKYLISYTPQIAGANAEATVTESEGAWKKIIISFKTKNFTSESNFTATPNGFDADITTKRTNGASETYIENWKEIDQKSFENLRKQLFGQLK